MPFHPTDSSVQSICMLHGWSLGGHHSLELFKKAYISAASCSESFVSGKGGMMGASVVLNFLKKLPKLILRSVISGALPSLPFFPWQDQQLCIMNHLFPSSGFPLGAPHAVSRMAITSKVIEIRIVRLIFLSISFLILARDISSRLIFDTLQGCDYHSFLTESATQRNTTGFVLSYLVEMV